MIKTYYNEIDPFCAQWLRNLIDKKLIGPGDVDARSVLDVRPDDLKSYTRCHFFAGTGGWDLALKFSGFPPDREVWTGSCPCQPFSAAGQARKFADERHLWPYWFHLVSQRKPATILGEQVASKAGLEWFDLIWTDLEGAGYAVGVSDLCAAGVGAPHIRQRLWFVADADGGDAGAEGLQRGGEQRQLAQNGGAMFVADAECVGRQDGGRAEFQLETESSIGQRDAIEQSCRASWTDLQWLECTDGKARPTQPGLFPLAHGIPGRVGRLRAYGNAIVPQVAAEFIAAYLECRP